MTGFAFHEVSDYFCCVSTGDQDGKFTNWLREDTPGTCAVPRCVAMTVHTSDSGRESGDNFGWLGGSCALELDGYVCQYNYKGMCAPLKDEGGGPAVYSTPFHLISSVLTHIPHGSMASLHCPEDSGRDPTQVTAECRVGDDARAGWSGEAPFCPSTGGQSDPSEEEEDGCLGDHGCEHFCQSKDSDYYCYCAEGFVIDEDGYSCNPFTDLSSDSAGPTQQPEVRDVCVEMGCQHDCVETARGIRCTCPPGYQMGPDGRMCSDVDECHQQPCQQVCVNIPGTFHCTCHSGYRPDHDGECVDVDECLQESSCSGPCQNTAGSYTCLCDGGYQLASGGECVDLDECAGQSPCHHQCLNFMGGYQCYCENGFQLQPDGLTCMPAQEDEEYSSLSPDPSDSTPDPNPSPDFTWSSPLEPNFEVDSNFGLEFQTEDPVKYSPSGSNNHLNHVDSLSPHGYQTDPTPTQEHMTENEIGNEAEVQAGGRDSGAEAGAETGRDATTGATEGQGSDADISQDVNSSAEAENGSAAGKQKHDKSWLLVALLVPLCVFLVVMLALGIVYCTSCAVDKTLSFSNCHRWVLPSPPPETGEGKTQA